MVWTLLYRYLFDISAMIRWRTQNAQKTMNTSIIHTPQVIMTKNAAQKIILCYVLWLYGVECIGERCQTVIRPATLYYSTFVSRSMNTLILHLCLFSAMPIDNVDKAVLILYIFYHTQKRCSVYYSITINQLHSCPWLHHAGSRLQSCAGFTTSRLLMWPIMETKNMWSLITWVVFLPITSPKNKIPQNIILVFCAIRSSVVINIYYFSYESWLVYIIYINIITLHIRLCTVTEHYRNVTRGW